MPKRMILNVATTHGYVWGQGRLTDSLIRHGWDVNTGLMKWTGSLPPGSLPHDQHPYAFKTRAIELALEQGAETVLWLDAATWAVKPLEPFFERIEREGHYFFHGGATLGQRSSDASLNHFGCTRDEAMKHQLIGGTVYGFDFRNPRTQKFWKLWCEYRDAGLFAGPAINRINEGIMQGLAGRPVGDCSSDIRCQGHCHDETCATWAAHLLGMESVPIGDGFNGYNPQNAADPRCFIVSQGI